MKELSQFLHLYLGCDVKADNGGTMIYTLSSVDIKGNCLFNDKHGNEMWLPNDKWKPILRPLSSMTDDEAVTVSKMATHLHENESWNLVKIDRISKGMIRVYFTDKWTFDFTKDYYVKVSPYPLQGVFESKGNEIIHQHHYQFPLDAYMYLLSKHFDLFGLHEAGLCLYETDLK